MKPSEAYVLHKQINWENSMSIKSFRDRYRRRSDKDLAINTPHMGIGGHNLREVIHWKSIMTQWIEAWKPCPYRTYIYRINKK